MTQAHGQSAKKEEDGRWKGYLTEYVKISAEL